MNIPESFSNLRTRAEFDDWPFGRQRCRCRFWIETGKRGERCCRVTENKARTGWNKAKKLTFAARMVIADGDDGKTYVLAWGGYGSVYVHFSDMKHATGLVSGLADDPWTPELVSDLTDRIRAVPSPQTQGATL